jgi:chromosome segregation and condensation protein ScpB
MSTLKHLPLAAKQLVREMTGLTPAQLEVAVAVVAADFTQVGPISCDDMERILSAAPRSVVAVLERTGWIEVAGYIGTTTSKLYRATPKAWKSLGLEGWSLLKEVA